MAASALLEADVQRRDVVAIVSDVCIESLVISMAAQTLGFVTVGIDRKSDLNHRFTVLEDAAPRLIVADTAETLRETLDRLPVGADGPPKGLYMSLERGSHDTDAQSWAHLVESAKTRIQSRPDEWENVSEGSSASDATWLFYTSGTTGRPKGALLSWSGLVEAYDGLFDSRFATATRPTPNDVALHEVPWTTTTAPWLALICPLIYGCQVEIPNRAHSFEQARSIARPSVYYARPGIWTDVANNISLTVDQKSKPWRACFTFATSESRRGGVLSRFASKFKAMLGVGFVQPLLKQYGLENVKFAFTAGAPMPSVVMSLWSSLGIRVIEYYGMTECSGVAAIGLREPPEDGPRFHSTSCTELRLSPEGEILIHGRNVFFGYLDQVNLTDLAIDAEGWLHTGDLGESDPGGGIRVIGRTSNVIVLASGESIPVGPLESAMTESPLIRYAICVGEARSDVRVLIEVDVDCVRSQLDIPAMSYQDLVRHDVVAGRIQLELELVNVRPVIKKYVPISGFVLLPNPLDLADSSIATVTRKIKRRGVIAANEDLIDALFHAPANLRIDDLDGEGSNG
jgi:long-chain acyl-CoA synthetase